MIRPDEPSFVEDRFAPKPEERLRNSDIDRFCAFMKQDETSKEIAEIYESKVPKGLLDVEKAIIEMRRGLI